MFACVCRDQKSTLGPPELGVTAGYESPHMGAGSQALSLCKWTKCLNHVVISSALPTPSSLHLEFILFILMCNNPNKTFHLFSAIFN